MTFNIYIYICMYMRVCVRIKAQNNMLGLGLLSEDAEWSEEGQIVI